MEPAMKNTCFAAIDFETANYKRNSACAVSIVVVRNSLIEDQTTYLIRPPDDTFTFTHIHGIRWIDVANKPAFNELWPHISKHFHGLSFVAAHNASFDRSVLSSCCAHYGIVAPLVPFICTVELARKAWSIFPTKLPDVCATLGISLKHHDATSDALACAHIVLRAINESKFNPFKKNSLLHQ
jgi:DNA polymerase-3 subunit epsilon